MMLRAHAIRYATESAMRAALLEIDGTILLPRLLFAMLLRYAILRALRC